MKKVNFILVFLLVFAQAYSQERIDSETTRTVITNGISLGSVIAAVTSWERNKSVLWAVIHGIFSWFYVIYFVLTRRADEKK
ncbi:MAG: hypothetical protein VX712_01635 [Bacteroidota bacterium]|uniref:Uncharacterized protein n=1 Tax=Christiangramia flava JLT2011 TaxID=1229726 RepID=A0A1L7I155_9FLAO|nr:hypothetical protein [Christiangramia flava]APU67337.1 hypothetical protein GRFL_0613 [Christiangramia flava JLT2011]MAM19980.1 hypothetical protein [Christiangramia sp.]MEE2770889.1 hypothetical protein [Bacteroidota bacterium]OSS39922.1 hypothetical protein C723_1039 [Christiangramia flava JLT2011]|tara:strand:+ start:699 stop:944 length:246 start_codon:yes stop_codon:yes gene_type:complete